MSHRSNRRTTRHKPRYSRSKTRVRRLLRALPDRDDGGLTDRADAGGLADRGDGGGGF